MRGLFKMIENTKNEKFNRFIKVYGKILSSNYFPFITAVFLIAFYYLEWDLVAFYYMTFVGVSMLLFLKDLTPLIIHVLFLYVTISYGNSPSPMAGNSDYYTRTYVLVNIGIVLTVFLAAVGARIFMTVWKGRLKISPTLISLFVLAAVLLLNGLFVRYNSYDENGAFVLEKALRLPSFTFGVVMAACFLVGFTVFAGNVEKCEANYIKIGWGFFAFGVLLLIELFVHYITKWDSVFVDGSIEKPAITFGWGVWITMGMLLVLCIPPVCLLASKYKYGYGFTFFAALLAAGAFMTVSRQAMLGAALFFPVCSIIAAVKGKNRILHLITLVGMALIIIVVAASSWDAILRIFDDAFQNLFGENGEFLGNGRARIMKLALDYFIRNPIFGAGFFVRLDDANFTGLAFIPQMVCNTFCQMLSACGIIGLLVYVGHRAVTVYYAVRRPNLNKTFIALAVSVILFLSMFDNHIFYIFPTLVYGALLSLICENEPVKLKQRKTVAVSA